MSVSAEIVNNSIYTAKEQATQEKATGVASKLTSTDFLNLMMKQLQYQDPLEPVSNTEFVAQQAQFSQLETTQDIKSALSDLVGFSQSSSLIGKVVSLNDPDNRGSIVTGLVQAASFNGKDSSIVIEGKEYPTNSVIYVHNTASAVTNVENNGTENTANGNNPGNTQNNPQT